MPNHFVDWMWAGASLPGICMVMLAREGARCFLGEGDRFAHRRWAYALFCSPLPLACLIAFYASRHGLPARSPDETWILLAHRAFITIWFVGVASILYLAAHRGFTGHRYPKLHIGGGCLLLIDTLLIYMTGIRLMLSL